MPFLSEILGFCSEIVQFCPKKIKIVSCLLQFTNVDHLFCSQRNLDRHISVVHDQNKPFQCGGCGLTFARKERLKQHFERAHGGETEMILKAEATVEEITTIEIPVGDEHHELQIHIQHAADQ